MEFIEYIFVLPNRLEDEIETFFSINEFKTYYFDKPTKGQSVVKVYINLKNPENQIIEYLEGKLELLSKQNITEDEWLKPWRESLKPFEFIEDIWILPDPEKRYEIPENVKVIKIIPGTAFGTGLHPTTKLAAENLVKVINEGADVLDVGTGTGILSIISKLYGADKILSLDYDILAVEKANETFRLNNLNIEVKQSDLLQNVNENERYDIIIANIVVPILLRLLDDEKLDKILNENGYLILSGINKERETEIANKIFEKEYNIISREEDSGWISLLLQKRI
ncbi:ribosomal protein L11 methyltransferase [Marinitoga hydrogenitolerans DSM 16785]|uniref:Ribosomal protein L11 methyltransferase n=1 Tax=Marinitoga hydrogenitolerans (strain DSM 16785 / JCM 12826 / AT1271) TaxID=1122195 RepID=A0A1M4US91_MARH1|nr:50S ribosomal protein L11 methyltransferase [Marinitoga hydrogenitolerans]SHE59545.1 ribosomal protein L11 methyltransferase [Marinitoga hydrogenitolerans DSM 16785]